MSLSFLPLSAQYSARSILPHRLEARDLQPYFADSPSENHPSLNRMPLYEFRCPSGHHFEKFYRSIGTASTGENCPECGVPAVRRMSTAGLVFKGSGFYITDYGKDGKKAERDAATAKLAETAKKEESTKSAPESGDSKPGTPTSDAKPAAASESASRSESGSKSESTSKSSESPRPKPATGTATSAPASPTKPSGSNKKSE